MSFKKVYQQVSSFLTVTLSNSCVCLLTKTLSDDNIIYLCKLARAVGAMLDYREKSLGSVEMVAVSLAVHSKNEE